MKNDPKKSQPSSSLPVLPQVRIKTPCPMNWDEMDGDASRRFCGSCQKHVHNFAEMDAEVVSELLSSDQSVCAKIIRRPDGSILTREKSRISRRSWFARMGGLAASLIAMLTLGGCRDAQDDVMGGIEAPATGVEAPMLMGEAEMGDVAHFEDPPAVVLVQDENVKQEMLGKVAPATPAPEK